MVGFFKSATGITDDISVDQAWFFLNFMKSEVTLWSPISRYFANYKTFNIKIFPIIKLFQMAK